MLYLNESCGFSDSDPTDKQQIKPSKNEAKRMY